MQMSLARKQHARNSARLKFRQARAQISGFVQIPVQSLKRFRWVLNNNHPAVEKHRHLAASRGPAGAGVSA